MIQISNTDRDFIVRYIEETSNGHKNQSNKEYNLCRRARQLAKKLKLKESISQK